MQYHCNSLRVLRLGELAVLYLFSFYHIYVTKCNGLSKNIVIKFSCKIFVRGCAMKNETKYLIGSAFYIFWALFCTGQIVQAMMMEVGFSEDSFYVLNSVINAVQIPAMLLMIFLADKVKNLPRALALTFLPLIWVAFALLYALFAPDGAKDLSFFLICASSGVAYFFLSIFTILLVRLPYLITPMHRFAALAGKRSAVMGACSLFFSLLYSFIISRFDYRISVTVFFVLSAVSVVGCSLFFLSVKPDGEKYIPPVPHQKTSFADALKNKDLWVLSVPHFLLGVGGTFVGLLTVFGLTGGLLDAQRASYATVIAQVSTVLCGFLLTLLSPRLSTAKILLFSVVALCVFLPLTLVSDSWVVFLLMFLLVSTAHQTGGAARGVLTTEFIPESQIGAFSSVRSLISVAGSSIASLLTAPLVALVGYSGVLALAAASLLLSNVVYIIVRQRKKRALGYSL
jgi:hypothetical protein